MDENKDKSNKDNSWWKPVMFFYIKTTSWIIFPLVLGLLLGKYLRQNTGSQFLFFALMMAGFGITCFGIYREIKQYKKDLDKK
ncbi:MAG: hypothetical protein WA101_02190 [Minisyncoccia bacterium]